MPIDLLKNLIDECPADTPLLGMDVGKKTIGLAQCGPDQSLATPITTIKRTKFTKDLAEIDEIVREFEIGGFVIGLPANMDGSEGPRAQSIRDFAAEFYKQDQSFPHIQGINSGTDLWIALLDERLSTHTVEEIVDKSVEKRKTKQQSKSSGLKDKLAAQIILQNALDMIQARR